MGVATTSELVKPNQAEVNSSVTTPEGDHQQFIDKTVSSVNAAKPNILPFTKAQATPPEKQPIPTNSEHIQPGIHAEQEFPINISDLTHHAGTLFEGDGLSGKDRVIPNKGLPGKIFDRARKMTAGVFKKAA